MSITSEIRLRIKKEGDVALTQLSAKLNDVASRSVVSNKKFKDLANTLRQNDRDIRSKSINALNDYSRAWRELANSVDVTSREFKEATREAQRFERQAAKAQGRRGGGGRGGAIAAIGSAGLLGPEALVGAGIGAMFGMPLAGAAIGSTVVAPARRASAGIAEGVADINRFRIALAGVSDDLNDYEKSTEGITNATKRFLLPIDSATKQYTRLKASVRGAGLTTEDTTKVFNGIAAAITATGGSSEDLNSALVATSQVFSKGKVSAEELRQQIGERLPGAFTIFAESINKTPAQLDKALENGEVSLDDFLTFSEELFNRYGKSAEVLASAPENAGKRLNVALRNARDNYGFFFQKVGAALQDNTTRFVEWFNNNSTTVKQFITDSINNFIKMGQIAKRIGQGVADFMMQVFRPVITIVKLVAPASLAVLQAIGDQLKQGLVYQGIKDIIDAPGRYTMEDLFGPATPTSFGTGLGKGPLPTDTDVTQQDKKGKKMRTLSEELARLDERRLTAVRDRNYLEIELIDYQIRVQKATERFNAKEVDFNEARKISNDAYEKLQERVLKLREKEKRELGKIFNGQDNVNKKLTEAEKLGQQIVTTFAQGMGDAFLSLFDRAKSFRDVLGDILRQVASLLVNFGMQSLGKGIFPNLFPQALGGVMSGSGPMPLRKYARGGIAYGPQLAMFGEGSTPEAYVPLPDGRSIPVKIKGSSGEGKIVVNVDASGSKVQGDSNQSKALGAAIGAAVQNEIIKQKKPGGLLY